MKALILSQHDELVSTRQRLLSRESEIEHLKLLIAKLRRMQFGRKSEKLERQIEQLELKLKNWRRPRFQRQSSQLPSPLLKLAAWLDPHGSRCRNICHAK